MANLVAITNLNLCQNLHDKVKELCENGISEIVLREKQLTSNEYERLFCEILNITQKFNVTLFLHNFIEIALKIDYKFIWLPLSVLKNKFVNLKKFEKIVVSAHSEFEVKEALKLGANAVCLSHIFQTACKENLKPKGLNLIKNVRKFYSGEIYALGGVNLQNYKEILQTGADKIAIMSLFMQNDTKEIIKEFL